MTKQTENIQAAFVVVIRDNQDSRFEIGLAHRGIKGYSPGYGKCFSLKYPGIEAETYDEASEWVEHLNKEHYGHTFKEAAKIVASSMF